MFSSIHLRQNRFRRVIVCRLPARDQLVQVMAKTRRSSILAQQEESEPPSKRIKLVSPSAAVPYASSTSKKTQPTAKSKRSAASKIVDKSAFPERRSIPWKVGAHVSAAGGVENAIINAAAIGANAFALFLKSQRKWSGPPLTPDNIASFKARMEEYGYPSSVILPHGNYLVNLGNIDADKREKSYQCFVDELKRCEQLGLTLYNFHPGSTVGETTTEKSISLIAECINRAHKETAIVTTVLENMAGAGNIIGGNFSHLADIIAQVEDKTRVGVCLDTCHMFAAGYDIRRKEDWNATLEKFDAQVGLSYLRGMHLNDSKAALNSKKDRHESIGIGEIGIHGFHHIMNDLRVQNIPLILETPSFELPETTWAKEIEGLNRLSGLESDPDVTAQSEEIVNGIKAAVHHAQKLSTKGKSKAKPSGRKAAKRKAKREDDGEDDGGDEEQYEG